MTSGLTNNCNKKKVTQDNTIKRKKKKVKPLVVSSESSSKNEISDTEMPNDVVNGTELMEIQNEQYYAVYYDDQWYIGRVISIIDKNRSEMKFLRSCLDNVQWPKVDDIQVVKNQYIIDGPIKLQGNNPFQVKREDILIINSKFKKFKQQVKRA